MACRHAWCLGSKVFTFHYPHERQASGTLYAMLTDTLKQNISSPLILFDDKRLTPFGCFIFKDDAKALHTLPTLPFTSALKTFISVRLIER
ncbi:MAG: hypothetical protein H0W84_00055 [Bacteroidetes bacterium]|nr:hypothetical protein [Bacteroidota bacterium]